MTACIIRSWDYPEPSPAGETKDTKVAPVQSENGFDALAVCQMYQRSISELYTQTFVLGENRGNSSQILLIETKELKRESLER